MANPFQNISIRDWFFLKKEFTHSLPQEIGTLGSNPYEEIEFDSFLKEFGFETSAPREELSVLVIGREEWQVEELHAVIEGRRGRELRVYSQEMVLSLLGCGLDPLDFPEISIAFSQGHPALEYILEWGFDWPNTRIVPPFLGSGMTVTGEWKRESFLKIMGYTTGIRGRTIETRRDALLRTFLNDLPPLADASYRTEWGLPGSGTRLRKIAERLSINITNQSALGHDEATGHNLEDLEWLKVHYYDGKHTFRWPSHHVV